MADEEYDFCQRLKEWQKVSNHQEKKKEFFRDHAAILGLDKTESCISIGAGHGDVDSFLVAHCMPVLKQYYGEEPNEEHRKLPEKNMSAFTSVQVEISAELAEDWVGPRVKVDLVLVLQSLCFVNGKEAFLSKCYNDWLKPGGQLIVVVSEKTNFVQIAAQKFTPESPGAYHADQARDLLLKAIGLKDVAEYKMSAESWASDGDRNYMTAVLNRNPQNEEEVKAFYQLRRQMCPGNTAVDATVFQCIKPRI